MMLRKMFFSLLIFGLVAGCDEKREFNLHKRTPQESSLVALKSSNADDRYRGLVELEKSKAFHDEWAVKVMIVIARTDPSSSVRALAVHNLGRVNDTRVWSTLFDAMDDSDDRVRFEAAWALAQTSFTDPRSEADKTIAQKAPTMLIRALASDPCLDVRINAARALGQFKNHQVLLALIAALKDNDFAVRFEAERSLIRLTGKTFQGNSGKWLAWIDQVKDPFADAGKTPCELVVPKRNFFQQTGDSIQRFYLEWQGPAKK